LPNISPAVAPMPIPAPMPTNPSIATPVVSTDDAEESNSPPPICWSCRNPIEGAVLGCPACGARYHGEGHASCSISSIEKCVSCSGPTSDFIEG
jgi:hypothetical protein